MKLKKLLSLICLTTLFFNAITQITVPVSAVGKETVKRTIAIVYDNSGSMYMNKNKAWCQALYAVEVFATMMNPGDKLLVYPMNPMGPDGEAPVYDRDNPLIITNDSQKSIINTLKSDLRNGNNNTPIEPIDFANERLKKEDGEKWLVLLTDGAVFYENEIPLEGKGETNAALEERFSKYISDSNILYLGIGKSLEAPKISSEGTNIYVARTAASENVPTVLTEMCNMIFGRDTLPKNHMSASGIDFDIPLSKLYVFIQGEGIENVKLMKGKDELTPTQSFKPVYGKAGCISDFKQENNFDIDTTLMGYIASYENLDKGTYTYSYSGKASSTAFYYEVDADLVLTFKSKDGIIITDPEEVTPGDYTLEYALVDKNGNILKSDLLGKVDFKLKYAINGKDSVKSSNDAGQLELHMDEETEFVLKSAEVDFLSGYKIRKRGIDFPPFKFPLIARKLDPKSLRITLSGGTKNVDANLVGEIPAYTVTFTYDGKQLQGDELNNIKFNAGVSTDNVICNVKRTDSGYEIKLSPKEGLIVVPRGKYVIKADAVYSSATVKDSKASTNTSFTVNEVNDTMSLELNYSNTVFSTLDNNVPEITANLRINKENLTPEQFEKLEFTAESTDGIGLIIKPLPEKSAYLITVDPDKTEVGEYPIKITATGVKARNGDMLTVTNENVTITVRLMPTWLVILLWIIGILLLSLIIWLWLRTPVLPKNIKLTNISVSVAGSAMKSIKANVIYPKKGKKRQIKIKGTGDLSNAQWSATLVPAKDSYRYLPSKNRKAMVVNGSVTASGYVSNIRIGTEVFSRNNNNKLIRISKKDTDFSFPKARMSYSGTKDIAGSTVAYSITGDIKFE